jgi:uncharacterized protein (TIGR03382 family)
MNSGNRRRSAFLTGVFFLLLATTAAPATTLTLDLSDWGATEGVWSAGDSIQFVITAESDGASNQGFDSCDLYLYGHGMTVDPTLVKITNVTVAADFTDYLYDPDISADGSEFNVITGVDPIGGDQSLGTDGPVDFMTVTLEVQSGFTPGSTADVTFDAQVSIFNDTQPSTLSTDFFGTLSSDDENVGTIELTNLPEPVTAVVLLAGLGALLRRRK